ncbi:MAG: AAA family ATPase [Deltaproteobacteria bacterium]|nr:AAA family ATPase [Deltaproteobacteria bacterium]
MPTQRSTCPACSRENRPGARFCGGCGRSMARTCTACRHPLAEGDAFCDRCGAAVDAAENAAPERAGPRDYTPRHLAERILRARSALEGERKLVTVLFADVKGSVELASGVDPEVWHEVMNRFFEIVARGVHRFDGTVNQYTGDGAMALFGAPIAHEDHAQRACWAALVLRDELRAYAEELKRTQGLGFSTRLGLNSGEVVVGKIGDDLRMDYTAQGHTVSLAARMEQLAAPGNAYLTGHTARLVQGFFELRDLGEFDLKGVRDPVPVYELEGAGPLRTRLEQAQARGLSRFVRRAEESDRLDAALERAARGALRVVGLEGEGGVGKSRLCLEFVERCRASGVTVLETHVPSHARSVPLLPWQTLCRAALGVDESDPPERARERIAGRLLRLAPDSLEGLPALYELTGVPDPEAGAPDVAPERRQEMLLALLGPVLRAHARERPVVLLWEDLHWIDDASDRLLAQLVDALSDAPALLVLNFRPGYRAPWMLRSIYEEIALAPLASDGALELLGELLGDGPDVRTLAPRIVERTGGNPFFLEEVARSLVESGQLAGGQGAYRLTGPLDDLEVPATVQTLLAARIDRLGDAAKQVLQTAAVIGKRFPELLLRRVTGLPDAACSRALDELRTAGLIHDETVHPVAEYAFKHPLTRDVAYSSQLGDARRRLHGRVAQELLGLGSRHADERAAVVAHHLERGGEALEAARWHRVAAEAARFVDARATVFHWQRVRELAAEAGEASESLELRLTACWSALDDGARAALPLDEVRRLFDEGMRLADRSEDGSHARVRLHEALAARLGWSGDLDGEREHLARAAELAERLPDTELKLVVLHRSYVAEFHRGDLRAALALASRGVELAESDAALLAPGGPSYLYREQLLSMANMLLLMGELRACASLLERGDAVARQLGTARHGSRTMHTRALIGTNLCIYRGEREAGLREAHAFVALAERTGQAWAGVVSQATLGHALLRDEQWAQARDALERALDRSRQQQLALEAEGGTLAHLAEACAQLGEPDRALAVAEEAVALTCSRGARFWEIQAQAALARVLVASGRAGDPRVGDALARAGALVEETGARALRPELAVLRAERARVAGDRSAAEAALRDALDLCNEIEAHGHAASISAVLGETSSDA